MCVFLTVCKIMCTTSKMLGKLTIRILKVRETSIVCVAVMSCHFCPSFLPCSSQNSSMKVPVPSQHGFMRGRSCLTDQISFHCKVTCLVDEGNTLGIAYLDFSKTFDIVSYSSLTEKLAVWMSALFTG